MEMTENQRRVSLDLLDRCLLYHEQTKHRSHAYARSLGRMEWSNQPNAFRHYAGAPLWLLPQHFSEKCESTAYDFLFEEQTAARPLDRETLSFFLYHSLALSAWKLSGASRWSLRVNPSSGNLHPTEAYLFSGPLASLSETPFIAHYDPYYHGLEARLTLSLGEWNQLKGVLPDETFVIGLTSIHWRESWKYGERAYRYCQHDIGHAVGCLQVAALMMGWELRAIEGLSAAQIEGLFGVSGQSGHEREHGACLFAVVPQGVMEPGRLPTLRCGDGFSRTLAHRKWQGEPNQLSTFHHDWPIIDFVREAVVDGWVLPEHQVSGDLGDRKVSPPVGIGGAEFRSTSELIRRRRSAVAMDAKTWLNVDDLYRLLWRCHPRLNAAFFGQILPKTHLALVFFVHRVEGLNQGLYLLCREPKQERRLRSALRSDFAWSVPVGCPEELDLFLLRAGDFQDCAKTASCHQSIAADGAFAVAMLADFLGPLREQGPGLYPRLFWEAGAIGQMMYLEAEASGVSATGIGCYFDDAVHQVLGLSNRDWQSLYHFTVGGRVDDGRLQTEDAYQHLTPKVVGTDAT